MKIAHIQLRIQKLIQLLVTSNWAYQNAISHYLIFSLIFVIIYKKSQHQLTPNRFRLTSIRNEPKFIIYQKGVVFWHTIKLSSTLKSSVPYNKVQKHTKIKVEIQIFGSLRMGVNRSNRNEYLENDKIWKGFLKLIEKYFNYYKLWTNGNVIRSLEKRNALAGNRTRAARVAGEHSTTEPPVPLHKPPSRYKLLLGIASKRFTTIRSEPIFVLYFW